MVDQLNVLIAGGGLSGPALGLLLSRVGHKCTIVERAPNFRSTGQQIDVSGRGLQVAQFMGIEDAIRQRIVFDNGMRFMNTKSPDEVLTELPRKSTAEPLQWVRELEILRAHLAEIMYEKTKDLVEYRFGDQIVNIRQDESSVTVRFQSSPKEETFDFVVAADGLRSRTRDLAFAPDNTKIVSLGQYVSFFDIPWQEGDEQWTAILNDTEGRCVVLRPRKEHMRTGAYLTQVTEDCGEFPTMSREEQFQELVKRFGGMGWQTPRILKEMQKQIDDDNFYMAEVAQTKSTSFSNGRVALLGDAAYAGSPVSGEGTTLAFTGAYILAGCLATYSGPEAMAQYEKQMRPFAEASQKLPPGIPWIVHPQTERGLTIRDNLLRVAGLVSNSWLAASLSKIGGTVSGWVSKEMELPKYPALDPHKTNGEES